VPEAVSVRLPNWLGDTVMAVPALRALRTHWPTARILLAGPWAALLSGQALADALVTYPRRWSGRLATADIVRRFGAEVAVLLPNSLEAALAARYWGARRLVGFRRDARGWLLTDAVPLPRPRRHQVDEYATLVERLGVAVETRTPRLAPPGPDSPQRQRVRQLLFEAGRPTPGGRVLVGLHLGAAHGPAKTWPADRVVALVREVAWRGGVAVLLGEGREAARAAAIERVTAVPNLVGRDTPDLLPAVLAELDVLVSGDTGVAHLAAALGTPVVALFGPTDPTLTAPRGQTAVVRHPVPCAPCFYRVCPIDHGCMRGIAPSLVCDEALALAGARTA
jgi:heptosyltransferase-2